MQNTLLAPDQTPTLAAFIAGEAIAPLWVSPSGRAFYPIAGGAPDDADDDADQDADADGDGDDDADGDDADKGSDGADDKDDDTDWKAKFEAEQRHKRNLERKARKDAATIARLTGKKPEGGSKGDGDKVDAEAIREEARAEARAEQLAERVADKIEAKASKFADPEDAVAVLLRSHKIDDFLDDGKVDVEAITDALKELGEKKPHLLAQGGRFKGDADGGRRKGKGTGRPKDLGDAISRHYAGGSK